MDKLFQHTRYRFFNVAQPGVGRVQVLGSQKIQQKQLYVAFIGLQLLYRLAVEQWDILAKPGVPPALASFYPLIKCQKP